MSKAGSQARPVALGRRLAEFPEITTLGVRPNLADYPQESLDLIRRAKTVYYPSHALAFQLNALGKRIFPSLNCHIFEGDKIRQTNLFELADVPHPRTKVYYGSQKKNITTDFCFPFIAKIPRGSSLGLGVFVINSKSELDAYLTGLYPAYIQELLSIEKDLRVVVIGKEAVCAYWRLQPPGDHRCNVARGGEVSFENIPGHVVDQAVRFADTCGLDDVGIDVAVVDGKPYFLEFNMKYGHKGPGLAGIDIRALVVKKILAGEI